ncbi:MAG: hypothetical protein JSS09_02690, partial [Verrucomicrobia bacterium]|nr:hypothetical protein [Verrucomicrobiota bacterium]
HTFHNKLFLGESERQGKSILSDGNNFFEIESKQLTQFLSSNDDKKIPCKKITKDTPFIPLGSEKAISAYLETPGTLSIRLDSNNDPILTFTPGEENFGEEFNETTL